MLPCEVRPDAAAASHSQASGRLTVTMPKEDHRAALDITCLRPAAGEKATKAQGGNRERGCVPGTLASDSHRLMASGGNAGMQRATVAAAGCDGKNEEQLPPL